MKTHNSQVCALACIDDRTADTRLKFSIGAKYLVARTVQCSHHMYGFIYIFMSDLVLIYQRRITTAHNNKHAPKGSTSFIVCALTVSPSQSRSHRVCRGAWARVTIDQFRHSAFQSCMGHRASTKRHVAHLQEVGVAALVVGPRPGACGDNSPSSSTGPKVDNFH